MSIQKVCEIWPYFSDWGQRWSSYLFGKLWTGAEEKGQEREEEK